jgi:hypothetical protein
MREFGRPPPYCAMFLPQRSSHANIPKKQIGDSWSNMIYGLKQLKLCYIYVNYMGL